MKSIISAALILSCLSVCLTAQQSLKKIKTVQFEIETDGKTYREMEGTVLAGNYYNHLKLFSSKGNLISKDVFTSTMTAAFIDSVAIMTKEIDNQTKWGIISKDGEVIIPFKYDKIDHIKFQHVCGKIKDDYYFLGLDGSQTKIKEKVYHAIFVAPKTAACQTKQNGLYGLKDYKGNEIKVDEKFELYSFNEPWIKDVFPIQLKSFEHNLMTNDGKILLSKNYDVINLFGDYFHVDDFDNYKESIYDLDGAPVSVEKYKHISPFDDGMNSSTTHLSIFERKVNGKTKKGVINKNFEEVVPPKYEELQFGYKDENLIFATESNGFKTKKGIVDYKGNIILEPNYQTILFLSQNDVMLYDGEFYQWMNLDTKKVVDKKFHPQSHCFTVKEKDVKNLKVMGGHLTRSQGCSVVNNIGDVILDDDLHNSINYYPSKGYLRCRQVENGEYYIFDDNGNQVFGGDISQLGNIEFVSDDKKIIYSDFLYFQKDKKFGVVKFDGQVIIEPTYLHAPKVVGGKYLWFISGKKADIFELK